MPGATVSLRSRALQWLATREHSRQELRDKLARWAQATALVAQATRRASDEVPTIEPADLSRASWNDIDALLDELARQGLLSDERFVESRVHARSGRFGNRRIEQELKRHGVAPSADVRQQLKHSEFERAREVWLKRFGRTGARARFDALSGDPTAVRWEMSATGAITSVSASVREARGFTPETIRLVLDACRAPAAGMVEFPNEESIEG